MNFHKTFGIFALLHFIYRFQHVGPTDMNFSANPMTVFCLAMHALLSASSLIFKIPIKRIAEGPRPSSTAALDRLRVPLAGVPDGTFLEAKYSVLTPRYELNGLIVVYAKLAADRHFVGRPAGRPRRSRDWTLRRSCAFSSR